MTRETNNTFSASEQDIIRNFLIGEGIIDDWRVREVRLTIVMPGDEMSIDEAAEYIKAHYPNYEITQMGAVDMSLGEFVKSDGNDDTIIEIPSLGVAVSNEMMALVQSVLNEINDRCNGVDEDLNGNLQWRVSALTSALSKGMLTEMEFKIELDGILDEMNLVFLDRALKEAEHIRDSQPAIESVSSGEYVFDVFSSFADNITGTLSWFGYDPVSLPDGMDDVAFDCWVKPYPEGVFGVVQYTEDGMLLFYRIQPDISAIYGNMTTMRRGPRVVASCHHADMDFRALVDEVSPVGSFGRKEIVQCG